MYQNIGKQIVHEINSETGEVLEKIINIPEPTIRTRYTSMFYPKNMEMNIMPSMTVPDMSMTVGELVKRFAQGLPLDGGKTPLWEEEGDMPDMVKLDLAERQQVIEEAVEEIKTIEKRVKERKQRGQQMELDKIVAARVQAKLDEANKNKPV